MKTFDKTAVIFGMIFASAVFAPAAEAQSCASAPGDVTFTAGGDGGASIRWTPSTTSGTACTIDGYFVQVRLMGGAWPVDSANNFFPGGVTAASAGGDITAFSGAKERFTTASTGAELTGLTVGATYQMRVAALVAENSMPGEWSPTLSLTIPNLTATLTGLGVTANGGSPQMYPAFDAAITEYNIGFARRASAGMYVVSVTPTLPAGAAAAGAAGAGNSGAYVFLSAQSQSADLTNDVFQINGFALGVVTYVLSVASADGMTTKTYTLRLIIGPDISAFNLTNATAGGDGAAIPISPDANQNALAYTAGADDAKTTVGHEVAEILFTAQWTANGPNGNIGIRGGTTAAFTDNTGATGVAIPLAVGMNIIDLVFTKTGGAKSHTTYTFTIIRAAGSGPEVSFATAAATVAESAGSVSPVVNLSVVAAADLVIPLTAGSPAGLAGFTVPASVTIPMGMNSASFTIGITDDMDGEDDHVLTVQTVVGAGHQLAAGNTGYVLTVTDNDAPAKIAATGSGMGGTTAFIWALWDIPAGMLMTNPYEVRYRVQTPLGAWTTKKGADLGDTAAGGSCAGFSLASDCRQARLDGLTGPGVTYEFQVRAHNDIGAGEWSEPATRINSGGKVTAPAALADLAAEPNDGEVRLVWTAPANAPDDYRLRRRLTDADGAGSGTAAGAWQGWVNPANAVETTAPIIGDDASGNGYPLNQSAAGYTLTGLTNDVEYEIGVAAVKSEVLGAWTDVTVTVAIPATPPDPTLNAASDVTAVSFIVNWNKVTPAQKYHVRWRTAAVGGGMAGEWQGASGADDAGETVGDVASYEITGLTPETAYDYAVRANNLGARSNWMQSATAQTTSVLTAPAGPAPPTVSALSASRFTVNWVKVPSATKYALRWRVAEPQGAWLPDNAANIRELGNVMSNSVGGLTADTYYEYQVRAGNAAGYSDWVQGAAVFVTESPLAAQDGDSTRIVFSNTFNGFGNNDYPLTPAFHPRIYRYNTPTISVSSIYLVVDTVGRRMVTVPSRFGTTHITSGVAGSSTNAHNANAPHTYVVTVSGGRSYTFVFNTSLIPAAPAVAAPPIAAAKVKAGTANTLTLAWVNSGDSGAAHYVRWRTAETAAGAGDAGAWHSSDGADNADCTAAVPTNCGADQTVNNEGLHITGLAPQTKYDIEVIAVLGGNASAWVAAPATTENLLVSFNVSASAEEEDGGTAEVAVSLNLRSSSDISVAFNAADTNATATATDDYTITTASPLAIAAGETSATISVAVADDSVVEDNETVILTLEEGTGYALGAIPAHTFTIADDEVVQPAPAMPAVPTAAGVSTSSFAVNWAKVTDAIEYGVRWRTAAIMGGGGGGTAAGEWQDTSGDNDAGETLGDVATYTITGLTAGVRYDYEVRAGSGVLFSDWVQGGASQFVWADNSVVSFAVSDAAGVVELVPSFAGDILSYTARTITSDPQTVRAAWVGENEFRISITGVTLIFEQATAGNEVARTVRMAAPHSPTTITFKVHDTDGPVYTVAFNSSLLSANELPAAPATPTADAATATSFRINWTRILSVPNYHVRWRTAAVQGGATAGAWQNAAGEDTADAGQVLGDKTGYTVSGLAADTAYDYAVRTSNSFGNSAWVQGGAPVTTLTLATLSSLDVSQFTLAPTFDAANLSYALTVPFATTAVTITSATDTADAAITVDGVAATAAVTVRITDGDQIQIRVAAAGFAAQTYIIGVTINARKQIDVTADGEIDINDGILIARYLLGIRGEDLVDGIDAAGGEIADIEARIETEMKAGSFNVDNDTANKTTAADAILIARYLLGVESGAGFIDGQVDSQDENDAIKNIEKLINDAASP